MLPHIMQRMMLTVTPQLAYAVSSSCCSGLFTALLHALAHRDVMERGDLRGR